MRIVFIGLVVAAALLYYTNAAHSAIADLSGLLPDTDPEPDADSAGGSLSLIEGVENMVASITVPAKYAPLIAAAEAEYKLPSGILARLLWTESRFRDDIITGKVKSSAGALGIAQFMPATAMQLGVDPLDPASAIPGAARYLAQLQRTTGSWREAVAAYNWGIGNVQRKGLAKAPKETLDYLASIFA